MKTLISILLAFFSLHACCQQDSVYLFSYFKNNGQDGLHLAYSRDGYSFTALKNDSSFLHPELTKDKLMRDPCIIRGADNKFHLVWTVSWTDGGIGYANSADLVHWSSQTYLPLMSPEPQTLNAWAPEITYDNANNLYMIYWASTIPGRFLPTDSSGDGKYNHRMYYTTTKDFVNFSPTNMLYNHGFTVIDATIQKAGDEYIMFLKDETKLPVPEKNIRIATSKSLTEGYSQPSPPITGKYWAEGPTAIHTGNEWIVYFDKYTQHSYGAVTSTDLKSWKDVSHKIKFPAGTRHGTVIKISSQELAVLLKQ